jgi:hypothetical protein
MQLGGQLVSVVSLPEGHNFSSPVPLFASLSPSVPIFSAKQHAPKIYLGLHRSIGASAQPRIKASFSLEGSCDASSLHESIGCIFSDGAMGMMHFSPPVVTVLRGDLKFPCISCGAEIPMPNSGVSPEDLVAWVNANCISPPCSCCLPPNLIISD